MKFKVYSEKKQDMIVSLQNFFFKELDKDLGYIEANQLLDFIVKDLAIDFYNEGIIDSHKYICQKATDILTLQKENDL